MSTSRGQFARRVALGVALVLLAAGLSTRPGVADAVKRERVHFGAGASSATVSGVIEGRNTAAYLLRAQAGQHMTATLRSASDSVYFNIFAPGKTPGVDAAMFVGDTAGNTFAGALPASGDYLIQVYLYRNAARAGKRAGFRLDLAVTAASRADTDAIIPGTEFNATGTLGCARSAGEPLGQCRFGVKRMGAGGAELTIFWPDGGSRVIFFEKGQPVRYDESEADGGAVLTSSKTADLFTVHIGAQRFEFPDAAITGG